MVTRFKLASNPRYKNIQRKLKTSLFNILMLYSNADKGGHEIFLSKTGEMVGINNRQFQKHAHSQHSSGKYLKARWNNCSAFSDRVTRSILLLTITRQFLAISIYSTR